MGGSGGKWAVLVIIGLTYIILKKKMEAVFTRCGMLEDLCNFTNHISYALSFHERKVWL